MFLYNESKLNASVITFIFSHHNESNIKLQKGNEVGFLFFLFLFFLLSQEGSAAGVGICIHVHSHVLV